MSPPKGYPGGPYSTAMDAERELETAGLEDVAGAVQAQVIE